jgi:hypothetical protein
MLWRPSALLLYLLVYVRILLLNWEQNELIKLLQLLGLSVALLAIALALYLFLLYPLSVAVSTLAVGILTAATAAVPLLPIIWPGSS